jgi:hypothetical protein
MQKFFKNPRPFYLIAHARFGPRAIYLMEANRIATFFTFTLLLKVQPEFHHVTTPITGMTVFTMPYTVLAGPFNITIIAYHFTSIESL